MTQRKPKVGDYSIGSTKWPGLAKLMEEMGELHQVLGKIMATNGGIEHWDQKNGEKSDLLTRLIEELGDVRGAMIFFCEVNGLSKRKIHARAAEKLKKFHFWQKSQQGGK